MWVMGQPCDGSHGSRKMTHVHICVCIMSIVCPGIAVMITVRRSVTNITSTMTSGWSPPSQDLPVELLQVSWFLNFAYTHASHTQLYYSCTYSVSQKNPPWVFLAFFRKRLGIFSRNFTRQLHVPTNARKHFFIQVSATLTKLCHNIKRDNLVHIIMFKMFIIGQNACTLAFSGIFPKHLGIFWSKFYTPIAHSCLRQITIFFTQ